MEELQATTTAALLQYMRDVADLIEPFFPWHSVALRGEIHGQKMTSDRWKRVAAVLSSLSSISGLLLTQSEHLARNAGLQARNIANEMSFALFGAKDPSARMQFVAWWVTDVSGRMTTPNDRQPTSTTPTAA